MKVILDTHSWVWWLLPDSPLPDRERQALDRTVNDLPDSFHSDPADRIIVATARDQDLHLATHDAAIRKSRIVKLWKP